jgi:YVTN family beta-propeller protein
MLIVGGGLMAPQVAQAHDRVQLPTGDYITPLAPRGAVEQVLNPQLPDYPQFVAGGAVISRLSPDGKTLAVLCAGQNSLDKPNGALDSANSTQYVFLFDVSGPNKRNPKLTRVIRQTNAHVGLVWAPDGKTLYAAGGNDDAVYAYTEAGDPVAKIALGHPLNALGFAGLGGFVQPNAGGLAISADGKTLVVANNYNDSISVIDTASANVLFEHDLRPFAPYNEGTDGKAGGTYPFAIALRTVKGKNGAPDKLIAYVSANRDRQVVVIDVSSAPGQLLARISLDGNPLGLALDKAQKTLYVAQDNADQVAVIDVAHNKVVAKIDTRAPAGLLDGDDHGEHTADRDDHGDDDHDGHHGKAHYTGASPIAVTLDADGDTLFAVNDGANSVAVIPLRGGHANKVAGLIPTAYAPKDITLSADGSWMYIINGKSLTGPNTNHLFGNTRVLTSSTYTGGVIHDASGDPVAPEKTASYPLGTACDAACKADNLKAAANANAANQYQFQLEESSLVSAPVPDSHELSELTEQVAQNNFYGAGHHRHDARVMEFLHHKIEHVIYVVKENRTYDQILGDLIQGNGEPALTVFGRAITPNHHALASGFVTLDNFMDPGDGSMDGWSWATRGRVTSTEAITQQINYAFVNRGLSYESEGSNRNVPVGLDTTAKRDGATNGQYSTVSAILPGGPANLLAGTADHSATDAPFGAQQGHIFDAVLKAGLTVRNYGFLVNNIGSICSAGSAPCPGKEIKDPFAAGVVQVAALNPRLLDKTDLYFRGYDQNYPDLWRYNEWKREFDQYVSSGHLPSLTLFRVSHDHMGSFGSALAGVNTPETQQADDDLAVGKLVEAVANSPFAASTLVIITEDDCQDGPDHVDSHRATAYVVGPYVKKNAVVNTRYSQVNALRTIEDILGTEHINLNTASQRPMADVFDISASPDWSYTAVASTVLPTTTLDLGNVVLAKGPVVVPKHDAAYWASATAGFDFSEADRVPPARFNEVLWRGLMGGKRYPAVHSVFAAERDKDGSDE